MIRKTALSVGKMVVGVPNHHLPVVAMGSIPHIYRRAVFQHRATPQKVPLSRNHAAFFHMPTLLQNSSKFSRPSLRKVRSRIL